MKQCSLIELNQKSVFISFNKYTAYYKSFNNFNDYFRMGWQLHDSHGNSHGGSADAKGDGHGHKHGENLNIRAAFIHVLGDVVQSIGVFIAALVIHFKPEWQLADPICTFIFSLLVLFTTITILKDALLVSI